MDMNHDSLIDLLDLLAALPILAVAISALALWGTRRMGLAKLVLDLEEGLAKVGSDLERTKDSLERALKEVGKARIDIGRLERRQDALEAHIDDWERADDTLKSKTGLSARVYLRSKRPRHEEGA